MVHIAATATRFFARRVFRRAARQAVQRHLEVRQLDDSRKEVALELGGFSVGFTPPRRADSLGDLPL